MLDAPEVRSAVARCRQAGIRPVMITGTISSRWRSPQTWASSPPAHTLSGQELERMPQTELESIVEDVSVYARVSPTQAAHRAGAAEVSLWQ